MTEHTRRILSHYESDNPGVRGNLARMLEHGALAGTGKLVILPVDQGFEHGPARSFAANPAGYDPDYHFELAIDAGCNAYAAPLGAPGGLGGQVRGPDPHDPQAEQSRHAARRAGPHLAPDGERGGRPAAGLRRHRLHDLPGLGPRRRHVRAAPRAHPRGEGGGDRERGLVLPARLADQQGRRDRDSTSWPTPPRSPPSWERT